MAAEHDVEERKQKRSDEGSRGERNERRWNGEESGQDDTATTRCSREIGPFYTE